MFIKQNYEKLSASLNTSEEFLFAIERVTESSFFYETHDGNSVSPYSELAENEALQLWNEGGRENEIRVALPTEDAEKGELISWAHLTAEFDGEKWGYV